VLPSPRWSGVIQAGMFGIAGHFRAGELVLTNFS
jgi:hypothetical protein